MSADFVHLHLHSHYSVLDGVSKIPDIIDQTMKFDQPAVALTDHGNLFGAMKFFNTVTDKNKSEELKTKVKPIYGCELYLAPESRFDKNKAERKTYHLVLLAKDYEGYRNLIKLSSIGYIEGFYYKPRIDREVLREHTKGLVALTACVGGEIPSKILSGDEKAVDEAVEFYIDTFGKENLFLEIQNHKMPEEITVGKKLIEISRKTGLKLVATNDSHYVTKEDSILQEISFAIRDKTTLNDPNRFRYINNEFYIKSPEEMKQTFSGQPEAVTNTRLVAEMCNLDLSPYTEKQDHTPKYQLPENETADTFLRKMSMEGLSQRFDDKNIPDDYQARLDIELELISTMGFSNYFLVVQDFVNYAKRQGILVGPGRGSAAGAMVSYALSIINIDPLKYDLLFERFLNPERVSMPDIDVDFQDDRRDEVKEYIRSHYGYDYTADVITFGISKSRNALKDVGRVLEIPLSKVNETTKLISDKDAKKSIKKLMEDIPDLKKIYDKGTDIEKKWIDYSSRIAGTIRNLGSHASALIISDVPITDIVPLYKDSDPNSNYVTQFDGNYLEDNGLLKMDILGLSNLTLIKDCLSRIKVNHQKNIDLDHLNFQDSAVFELISSGDTSGVFQLESIGMKDMLKKMKPTRFEDIIAAVALYRPGPLGSGMVDSYIRRKHDEEDITYPHDSLEPVLNTTYGIIVYQEQVMRIAQVIAGFSLGSADILRRAMGKKKMDVMAKMRGQFLEGAKKNQIDEKVAVGIYDLIEKFAEYGFNKSHSAAYAMVTYITGYLKAHYRVEFMASLLTLNMNKSDDLKMYCQECEAKGIEVLPPNINNSAWEFREKHNNILFGFGGIKGIGESMIETIIHDRELGGNFDSFDDFIKRMKSYPDFKKSSIEILIKAGAFDSLLEGQLLTEKAILLANYDSLIKQLEKNERDLEMGQLGLFGDVENGGFEVHINRNIPPMTFQQEFENELEVFGFCLSRKIFDQYSREVGDISQFTTEIIDKIPLYSRVFMWGYISEVIIKIGSRNREFAIIDFDNGMDSFRFYLFAEKYEQFKFLFKKNQFLMIRMEISTYNDKKTYEIIDMKPFDAIGKEVFTQLHLVIDVPDKQKLRNELSEFRKIVQKNRGNTQLIFYTNGQGNPVRIAASNEYNINYSHNLFMQLRKMTCIKGYWLY